MYKLLTLVAIISLSGCATSPGNSTGEIKTHDMSTVKAVSPSISSSHSELIMYENNKTGIDSIISNEALDSFQTKYKEATSNKAFAQSVSGAWNWRSNRTTIEHAKTSALVGCQRNNKKSEDLYPCRVIHVNDSWVTPSSSAVPPHKRIPSNVESRPHVWSSHKELDIPAAACGQKGMDILNSLGFNNVVKSTHGEYIYGNYISNRAAVKCVPQGEGTFLYVVVAGPEVKTVEKLRNQITWNY